MDLRTSRVHSDVDILHDDPYLSGLSLSARDTYGIQKPPVIMYDPYANELDHLDKTIFLERRMRIQENIINRHKTEAERTKEKRDSGLSKHSSSGDIRQNKNSYSDIYIKQSNRSNKTNQQNEYNSNGIWTPREQFANIHGNGQDFPAVESLDTARGKARYALVRINSSGPSGRPQMYLESVHQMVLPQHHRNSFDQHYAPFAGPQITDGFHKQNENPQSMDPNSFIPQESRAILDKVNGVQGNDTKSHDIVKNDASKKGGENNKKKLTKKNSKITLNDLVEENDRKNPLTSRKTKQSLKAPAKDVGNEISKISRRDLDIRTEKKDRRLSEETHQSNSRKCSIIPSRQSTISWSKHSQATNHTDTPLSFNTTDSTNGTVSPVSKRGRHKRHKKQKNEVEENHQVKDAQTLVTKKENHQVKDAQILVTKKENKQVNNVPPTEPKSDTKVQNKNSNKLVKSNDSKNTKDQKQIAQKSQRKIENKNNDQSAAAPNISDAKVGEKKTSEVNNVKTKLTVNEKQKSKSNNKEYATKNNGLRKTDSFKMLGNSSHFFGYISVPEDEVKKPKSILKKTKHNPDRPDTA